MKKSIIVKENQYTKEELRAIEYLAKKRKAKGKNSNLKKNFQTILGS
ncbi:hypothetical protein KAS42_03145 [bacterium]|nr:hypothetical protein [bacterium]